MNEAHAISRGTRCKQFLFSLSLNPPPHENVETAGFERAIDRVEEKLKLTGQPRAIVFHEKEGRRHAHAVKGDRRGIVAVDMHGEVHSVAKRIGVKTKDVRARLGDANKLPSVSQAKQEIARQVSERLGEIKSQQDTAHAQGLAKLEIERRTMVARQQRARKLMSTRQSARWESETADRQQRFNKGLRGLIDRVSGHHRRIKARNENETYRAFLRNRAEKDALIFGHLEERRGLQKRLVQLQQGHTGQKQEIESDLSRYDVIPKEALSPRVEGFKRKRRQSVGRRQPRQREPGRDMER